MEKEGKRRDPHFCVWETTLYSLHLVFFACHYLCPSVETYKAATGNEIRVYLHLRIRGGGNQTPTVRILGCSRTPLIIKIISLDPTAL